MIFVDTSALIGALATEQAARVWSLDSDFARLARLGLLEVCEPVPGES